MALKLRYIHKWNDTFFINLMEMVKYCTGTFEIMKLYHCSQLQNDTIDDPTSLFRSECVWINSVLFHRSHWLLLKLSKKLNWIQGKLFCSSLERPSAPQLQQLTLNYRYMTSGLLVIKINYFLKRHPKLTALAMDCVGYFYDLSLIEKFAPALKNLSVFVCNSTNIPFHP